MGILPSSPAPATIALRSLQPSKVSVGHSLARQARSLGGQRWAFSLRYAPMTQSQFAPLWAFLVAQRGQYETFQLFLPSRFWPLRGAGGGSPKINDLGGSPTTIQLGDRTIYTDGWPASTTVLKAGDFVKFSGHSKVYMQTQDVMSDASGIATLTLEPALIAEPADNEDLTVGNVPFTVALASDVPEFNAVPGPRDIGSIFHLSLELVEVA